ncbi:PIN domain-like protein [Lactarius akahatsu]|uniref:PIN domain-like protein n=1 Tax=Lactarius akahatsu TaxID=416441 RepID=A0AAD4LK71_9AGAM|nr:PIN domain-like protein [Lactarius akahatsu]
MGVKSLWDLLTPLGRPVLLETMEGKALAIDSSIWIYQFQATMRDKEGKALVNAHVLGFLRRICKLLFYGIKPVFVFDGGAPALKRNTIAERKRKKSGAAISHAKVAERLLAARMRHEALRQAQAQRSAKSSLKGKGKEPAGPVVIDENTVYLEDLTGNAPPKTPVQKGDAPAPGPSPFSASKNRWRDHDPYRLPEVNLEKRVAEATRSAVPDPRLATEEELRAFIEEMRPEDFDVTAPAFRELPTEVQYEIVGDLRLKSRQTSYKRLQNMLKKSRTPLDFSKEQIKNLQQRNTLTQQLLITTDTIGQAHVSIPVRIASERNREYVLIKNTGEEGGWVLGIRDDGSKENPIQIDQDPKGEPEDSDVDMEEVTIPGQELPDPDLHEFQRHMALAGIGKRRTSKNLTPRPKPKPPKTKTRPLFGFDEDEVLPLAQTTDDDDPALQLAVQESLESQEEVELRRALEASRDESQWPAEGSASTVSGLDVSETVASEASDGDELNVPGRLETALAIANAGPTPKSISMTRRLSSLPQTSYFNAPKLLIDPTSPSPEPTEDSPLEYLDSVEEVARATSLAVASPTTPKGDPGMPRGAPALTTTNESPQVEPIEELSGAVGNSDDDMELVPLSIPESLPWADTLPETPKRKDLGSADRRTVASGRVHFEDDVLSTGRASVAPASSESHSPRSLHQPVIPDSEPSDEEKVISDWSRSPSPVADALSATETATSKAPAIDDSWDAAQEMDPHAEEGEFARFLSQVKGKDLDDVRREIDEEIKTLNQQKKAAMRDSEDITQQMIAQIMVMLRLFGIPYITAPMEAEAQCAALVELGLVEGIITDDSDVFLFGGARVYKNMFNQSKTVECFFLADFARELGLDRERLVQLAYLLGSDYVEGLPGVGPVVAMELLKEFSGDDCLQEFKDWWQRVQSGRDKPEESRTNFRRRFKKRFKTLYIPDEWPNPVVRDAYYHPTVDDSEEPFKWGLPDLDGLCGLLIQELGWNQSKVEELLLPIIQKIRKRTQALALNKQGNLKEYFGVSSGGLVAPRNRRTYTSKRLQQVVDDFREQRRKETVAARTNDDTQRQESSSESLSEEEAPPTAPVVAKRNRGRGGFSSSKGATGKSRGRGGARGGRAGSSRKRKRSVTTSGDDPSGSDLPSEAKTPPPLLGGTASRPKPRPLYQRAA